MHHHALKILECLHEAESELLGHNVRTSSGIDGTITEVVLDSHHGLAVHIDHGNKAHPISTVQSVECMS